MFSNSPRVRQIIYGLAIAAQIASLFVAIVNPELAAAFLSASAILGTVATSVAISNVHPTGIIEQYEPNVDGA